MFQKILSHVHPEKNSSRCFIQTFAKLLGDKWALPIIQQLINGASRYSEIEKNIPDISPRALSQRLQKLEQHNIISKTVTSTTPIKITYSLTPIGEDLTDIIQAINAFGAKYTTFPPQ
jgi:DNA-binding HxlR family transcriptional regulator